MSAEEVKNVEIEEVKKGLEEVNLNQDSNKPENTATGESKSKKKKNKKKAATEEKKVEGEKIEDKENLENDENEKPEEGPVCAHCKKSDPKKRCSKRHPKCLKKMFCNETCESLAHEDRKTAVAKKEANKVAAAKKKAQAGTKVKNWKNTDSGQFWWHDQ